MEEANESTPTDEKHDEGSKKHKRHSRAGRSSGVPEMSAENIASTTDKSGSEDVTATANRDSRRTADDSRRNKRSKRRRKQSRNSISAVGGATHEPSEGVGTSHSASQPATQFTSAVSSPILAGNEKTPSSGETISLTSAPPLPQVASPNLPLALTPGDDSPSRKTGPSASALLSPFNAGMLSAGSSKQTQSGCYDTMSPMSAVSAPSLPQTASPNPPLTLTAGDDSPSRKTGPSASALLSPFNAGMLSAGSSKQTQSGCYEMTSPMSTASAQPLPQLTSSDPAQMLTPGDGSPSRKARPSASALLSPFKEGMISPQIRKTGTVRAAQVPAPAATQRGKSPPVVRTSDHPHVPDGAVGSKQPQPSKQRRVSDESTLPIVVMTLLACTLIIVVIIIKVMPNKPNTEPKSFQLCGTPACVEVARRLTAALNQSISACSDFYRHVCGRWNDPKSAWRGLQSSFSSDVGTTLTTAGSAGNAGGPQSAVKKAALLYRSCEEVAQGADELERFRPMLRDMGVHWPNRNPSPDVLRTLLRLIDQANLHILVSIKMFVSGEKQQVTALELRAVSRYVSEAKHRYEQNEASNKAKDYFQAFYDGFASSGNPGIDFNEFRQLEKEGVNAFAPFVEVQRHGDDYDHMLKDSALRRIELGDLANFTPDISNSKQRWKTQLREQLRLASPADAVFMAAGRATDMLRALNGLIKNRTEQDAELFVGWLALQEIALVVSKKMARAAQNTSSWMATAHLNPEHRCLKIAEALLGWVVFAPFAVAVATEAIRQDIKNLVASTERALKAAVEATPWLRSLEMNSLPGITTGSFLEKMDKFPQLSDLDAAYSWVADMGDHLTDNWNRSVRSRHAAPLDAWQRVTTGFYDTDFQESGQQPESMNVLSPAALLLPAYADGTSEAHKYGALGSLVATGLLLRLDQRTHRAPEHEEAHRRLACYANESDLDWTHGAQEAALQLAWQAYRSVSPGDTRLQGLEGYSGDQLFFVAFAHLHCAVEQQAELRSRLVNSAVRNVRGFALSFACAPGDPMNPAKRCAYFGQPEGTEEKHPSPSTQAAK